MLRIAERQGNLITLEARGLLTKDDFAALTSELKPIYDEEKQLRLMLRLDAFDAWAPGGLLENLKWNLLNKSHFDKVAVIGDDIFEKYVGQMLGKQLAADKARYFEKEQASEARRWLAA